MSIQLKRSLSDQIDPDYVLAQGQIGVEMPTADNTETNPFKFKIGDGHTPWSNLPYFGYSTSGGTNPSKPEGVTYYYGYDLDKNNSNPATRVTYPLDVDNASYTPAYMNYATDSFSYGTWRLEPGEHFMPKPCHVYVDSNSNTTIEYLNPGNYKQYANGTAISSQYYSNGNHDNFVKFNYPQAMMEWNKIFTKRWETDGIYHFRCSDKRVDDTWECWCNYDLEMNEIPHFYTAIYEGAAITDRDSGRTKLYSSCNADVTLNLTAAKLEEYARAYNIDCDIGVLADWLLIQDLLVLMARSTDTQTAYGMGCVGQYVNGTGTPATKLRSGTMDTKGMFWGSQNTTSGVKVFGIENLWGNTPELLAGILMKGWTYGVKLTRSTKDGTTVSDYNFTGIGYLTRSNQFSLPDSKYQMSYYNTFATQSWGRLPISGATGSTTTYECDLAVGVSSGGDSAPE